MDNYSRAILKKKISSLIRRGALREKKIVLFGASVFSREIRNCLLEQGFDISGVVDNDSRKLGSECMGLKVETPETILLPRNDNTVVLLMSVFFYREMTCQLLQMGYTINKDVFTLNLKVNETLPVLIYMLVRVIRGRFVYQSFSKKDAVFVAPYTGIGDIYLIGMFFNEYLRQKAVTDYVFVVVSGACKKVAELFDIKNIVVIKPKVTDDLISCRYFMRTEWPIVVLNDGWLGEATQWIRGYKGLNFEKMFRYFVFGFDDKTQHELPLKKCNSAEIAALFQKHGLIRGRTVVLSPYSNTLFDLPEEIWLSIVKYCKDMGFAVCTNCAAGTEKPIAGTEAVFFPLVLAIEFLNESGYFVGVRSGFCDIISASTCKKVVIYEKEGFFYKCSPFDYFSLIKMGLCDDVIEIEYDGIKERCLSKILSALKNTPSRRGGNDYDV